MEKDNKLPIRRKILHTAWAAPTVISVGLPSHAATSDTATATTTVASVDCAALTEAERRQLNIDAAPVGSVAPNPAPNILAATITNGGYVGSPVSAAPWDGSTLTVDATDGTAAAGTTQDLAVFDGIFSLSEAEVPCYDPDQLVDVTFQATTAALTGIGATGTVQAGEQQGNGMLFAIIRNADGDRDPLSSTGFTDSSGGTEALTKEITAADLVAGNYSARVRVETSHFGMDQGWTIEFSYSYTFKL